MKIEFVFSDKDDGNLHGTMSFSADDKVDLAVVSEEKLFHRLMKKTNPQMGLLPPALRWVSADKRIIVFERPPQEQRVEFYPREKDRIRQSTPLHVYTIPTPWTVYVAYLNDDMIPVHVRVYARNEPIESLSSTIGLLPILNVYVNGELCNPIFERAENYTPTLANGISAAYNMVWNSGFNYDLKDALSHGMKLFGKTSGLVRVRYTRLGTPADDAICNYHKRWSETSLGDILNLTWPFPYWDKRGSRWPGLDEGEIPTIQMAIDSVRGDVEGSFPKNAQSLIVNIVNTITSI